MSDPFPLPFQERMRHQLGSDWEAFAEAHQKPCPVSVRNNPKKSKGIDAIKVPWSEYGFYLDARPSFTLDPAFHAGSYYVQDASSMFLEQAIKQTVDISEPIRALDLCSAPGGKATHLLSLLHRNSLVVANEVIRSRATILSENIQKWGYPNAVVTNSDPNDFHRLPGFFDLIVVDAPCSGEGLFRKDNSAMNEWSTGSVTMCSQRQQRILRDIWSSLKQNGILVYCTCTYNEEENEDNLAWLAEQYGVESIELKVNNSWGIQKTKKGSISGCRFYPHNALGEGFFMAVVRKTSEEVEVRTKARHPFSMAPKKITDGLQAWVNDSSRFKFVLQENLVLMLPASLQADLEFLSEQLKVINKGIAIATPKHDKLVPEHAIALSTDLRMENFEMLPLDKEQALSYLRKENLKRDEEKIGFSIVTYDGLPLGWVNVLINRMNNLYPSNWRVRMAP